MKTHLFLEILVGTAPLILLKARIQENLVRVCRTKRGHDLERDIIFHVLLELVFICESVSTVAHEQLHVCISSTVIV